MSTAPPANKPRIRNLIPYVAVGVALALIIAGFAIESWEGAHEPFTCPGVDWTVHYDGSASGYLDPSPPTGCLGYPATVAGGHLITIRVLFENLHGGESHAITAITVSAPSTLDSVSPTLPLSMPPDQSYNVTLNLTIPTLTGQYVVDASVATT
jgi:hypothetical protein